MLEYDDTFTVTDLKQYTFCQRVVYYERCLPHLRPRTYKMDAGRDVHEDEKKRAVRRTLNRFDVLQGERQFDVALYSETLHLRGSIDEVILADDGRIVPVDYKLANRVGNHQRLQLCAYALLLEERFETSISEGYLYLIPKRDIVRIPLTEKLRQQVIETLRNLREMVTSERMPPPVDQISRCYPCEFRRFCNDIGE